MSVTPPPLGVVHADPHLLVLEKPSGLLAVPGRGPERQDCLSARARNHFPDALIVHRLDMATSGLMVMARGAAAQRTLSIAFAERRVGKGYVAIVDGFARADDWALIDLPIALDWPNRPRHVIDAGLGKPSLTRWRALGHDAAGGVASTRVELEPITGRSHQLRVHMRAIGHPILGDDLYAPEVARARAGRLLLHARRLSLPHPVTGERLDFTSPAPF